MGDILSFFRPKSRRAGRAPNGSAPGAPLSAPPLRDAEPPIHSADVMVLEERRIPGVLPWCPPLPPYIGALVLGAAISATAAVTVSAAMSTMPARFMAAAFEPWSA